MRYVWVRHRGLTQTRSPIQTHRGYGGCLAMAAAPCLVVPGCWACTLQSSRPRCPQAAWALGHDRGACPCSPATSSWMPRSCVSLSLVVTTGLVRVAWVKGPQFGQLGLPWQGRGEEEAESLPPANDPPAGEKLWFSSSSPHPCPCPASVLVTEPCNCPLCTHPLSRLSSPRTGATVIPVT